MLTSQKFVPLQRTTASPLSHWHVAPFSFAPSVCVQSATTAGVGATVVVHLLIGIAVW
jgi:hypothetical protein